MNNWNLPGGFLGWLLILLIILVILLLVGHRVFVS